MIGELRNIYIWALVLLLLCALFVLSRCLLLFQRTLSFPGINCSLRTHCPGKSC
jgi:hypothetical protein